MAQTCSASNFIRESSVNMTRGGGGGGKEMKILRGELRKFLDTRKGGSENLYTLNPKGGGAPKKLNRKRGGLLKFQASSFNIFIPPPCHIK